MPSISRLCQPISSQLGRPENMFSRLKNRPVRRPLIIGRSTLTSTSTPVTARAGEPLRILFCGSDSFSNESLYALSREHKRNRSFMETLEVMVLPAKRVGRGLKSFRQVPCKGVAVSLGLKIHERGTFTGWELPKGTNLIVAVSFGLFVPPRILKSAKYGGLNVHPSFLPDLRGPAPIHHAMLRGDQHFGVSLQTLDDTRFDHGTILAQTPAPGFKVSPEASLKQVTLEAAKVGANLLIESLHRGVHVPPYRPVLPKQHQQQKNGLQHAPKMTKADAQVNWEAWTSVNEYRNRQRVFTNLWTRTVSNKEGGLKRLILFGITPATTPHSSGLAGTVVFVQESVERATKAGELVHMQQHEKTVVLDTISGACFIRLSDGAWLRLAEVQVEGLLKKDAVTALRPYLRQEGAVDKR